MGEVLSPAAARRVFLLLTLTRWFPVGLVVGLMPLLALERGLSVSQTLLAMSVAGFVVFALELPTSGFADAFGRRPIYVAASVVNVVAALAFVVAQSFWGFALAAVLTGVFRALDSGPLEAWYVDTVHATEPGADVDRALSLAGTVLGAAIAAGALVSGGLVLWDPLPVESALLLPFLVFTTLNLAHLGIVVLLLHEPRTRVDATGLQRARRSAREAPAAGACSPSARRWPASPRRGSAWPGPRSSPGCSTGSARSRWGWSPDPRRWSRPTSSPTPCTAPAGRCTTRCCTARRRPATGRRCCR